MTSAVSASAAAPLSPHRPAEPLSADALAIQPHCRTLAALAQQDTGVTAAAVLKELNG